MASGGFKDYLTFRALGLDCATEAAQVRGIVPAEELLRFEGLPAGIAGIGSFRGRPVVVLDLCKKLEVRAKGGKPAVSLSAPAGNLVVIEVGAAEHVGFLADRVSSLTCHTRNVQNGYIVGHGRRRRVLDFAQLVTPEDLACLTKAGG